MKKVYQYLKVQFAFFTKLCLLVTNQKGIGLLELLTASSIMILLLAGSTRFIQITLESANVSRALLTEDSFKQLIAKGLEKQCDDSETDKLKYLEKDDIVGTPNNGIGELTAGFVLSGGIKKGKIFNNSIEVVKMELKGDSTNTNTKATDFFVYYKKKGLGKFNAPDATKCPGTGGDVSGCFQKTCSVTWKDQRCKGSGCHYGGNVVAGGAECYTAENTDSSGQEAKTLVGCGGANESAGQKTVAIGYGAGKANTGSGSTFVGYKTGLTNTGGAENTFIGAEAGKTITTGNKNIAIGHNIQLGSPTGSNQINIGNIIKAKTGILKVCDNTGEHCKAVGKQKNCGDGQVVRGIDSNGNLICVPGCTGNRHLVEKIINGVVYRQCECIDKDKKLVRSEWHGNNLVSVNKCMSCTSEPGLNPPYWHKTRDVSNPHRILPQHTCFCGNFAERKKKATAVGIFANAPNNVLCCPMEYVARLTRWEEAIGVARRIQMNTVAHQTRFLFQTETGVARVTKHI